MSHAFLRLMGLEAGWCLLPVLGGLLMLAGTSSFAVGAPASLEPETTLIVLPDKPETIERTAAGLLTHWLRKAAGVERGFEVVSESAAADRKDVTRVALGNTRWSGDPRVASLAADGFLIRQQGNIITITGPAPSGTYYGAVEFLSQAAGVRFYMPGDLWTSLPASRSISYHGRDVLVTPFVTSAYMSGINQDDRPGAAWARINGAWRRKGGTHQHNLFEMFPPGRWAESHPEIFPIYEGQRYIPKTARDQSWQNCFSQLQTVEAAMVGIHEHFKKFPNNLYATLSINDGGKWCECEQCAAALEAAKASAKPGEDYRLNATTEIYWGFMNKVAQRMAQECPGKLLVGLAYGPTRQPSAFKLADNIVVFTNFHIAELPTDGFMESKHGRPPLLDQWLSISSHMGNHDWYQGSGYLIPRIYSGYWSRFMRELDRRQDDAFQHCEAYPSWYLDGPKYYIVTRLWWDPQADPVAITRQFCEDMFGQAGGSMLTYYQTLEAMWEQLNITDGPERKLQGWATQFRTTPASRQLIAAARAALDQAAGEAQGEDERKRIALIDRSFALSEQLFAMAYHSASSPEGLAAHEKAQAMAPALMEDRMAVMHANSIRNAIADLRWSRVRAESQSVRIPAIAAPTFGDDATWQSALRQEGFAIRGAGQDKRGTSLRIGHDEAFIYLRVEAPRSDMDKIIETPDDSWRSDNIEVFIDTDGDPDAMDRQFWIKTTGRLVNHTRDAPAVDQFRSHVRKLPDRLIVEVAIPLAYMQVTLPPAKPVTLQVLRNEFKAVRGVNELDSAALWNRQIQFSLP